jgi:hypothetical protein
MLQPGPRPEPLGSAPPAPLARSGPAPGDQQPTRFLLIRQGLWQQKPSTSAISEATGTRAGPRTLYRASPITISGWHYEQE